MTKKILIILFISLFSFSASAVNYNVKEGSANAPVKLKLFYSMTCSACSRFHKGALENIKEEYVNKGKVSIEYAPYPLDYISFAIEAYLACVPSESAHKELIGNILDNQDEWINKENKDAWIKNKLSFYMDKKSISSCQTNKESASSLADRISVYKDKRIVYQTPSLFINGKRATSLAYKSIKEDIDNELNK